MLSRKRNLKRKKTERNKSFLPIERKRKTPIIEGGNLL